MAIVHLGNLQDRNKSGFTASIYSFTYSVYQDGEYVDRFIGPVCHYTYISHEGLCLREYEKNYYDDSFFHMIVWNPETKQPEDICFAATIGWSYPCLGSKVDATPEVRAEYEAYLLLKGLERADRLRKERIVNALEIRKILRKAAKELGFNYGKLATLRRVMHSTNFQKLVELLTKKIRSGFKISLRNQLINWLNSSNNSFKTPLSEKQLSYL